MFSFFSKKIKPLSINDDNFESYVVKNRWDELAIDFLFGGTKYFYKYINLRDIDGFTPILYLCKHTQNMACIRSLVIAGCDINAVCKSGNNSLYYVLDTNCLNYNLITFLIENKIRINTKKIVELFMNNFLRIITKKEGKFEIFKCFINNTNINIINSKFETCLTVLCKDEKDIYMRKEMIQFLLDRNILLNYKSIDGYNAPMFAVMNKSLSNDILENIINNPNTNFVDKSKNNETILMCSYKNYNKHIFNKILLKSDVNSVDDNGKTLLMTSVENIRDMNELIHNFDILLSNNIDVNRKDKDGNDILSYIYTYVNDYVFVDKIIRLLLSVNYLVKFDDLLKIVIKKRDCIGFIRYLDLFLENDPNFKYRIKINEKFFKYVYCNYIFSFKQMDVLHKIDGILDFKFEDGNTILYKIIESYNSKYIKNMFDYYRDKKIKFDTKYRNNRGETALFFLIKKYVDNKIDIDYEIINYFMGDESDLNIGNNFGWTIPMILSKYGAYKSKYYELLKIIMKYKPNLNVKNKYGDTALSLASSHSNNRSSNNTVKLLLENGANPNIQDKLGDTALTKAISNCESFSNYETVKLLLNNGAKNFKNRIGWDCKMYLCKNCKDNNFIDECLNLMD